MRSIFFLYFLSFGLLAFAHEGHNDKKTATEAVQDQIAAEPAGEEEDSWLHQIGKFHLILLHFPIALINMVAIAEILWVFYRKSVFESAARFMLVAAAVAALPTALFGLIYSYSESYSDVMKTYLLWHMWLGIATAVLAIATAFIRENKGATSFYYATLALLVLILNLAAFFGGEITFGH